MIKQEKIKSYLDIFYTKIILHTNMLHVESNLGI